MVSTNAPHQRAALPSSRCACDSWCSWLSSSHKTLKSLQNSDWGGGHGCVDVAWIFDWEGGHGCVGEAYVIQAEWFLILYFSQCYFFVGICHTVVSLWFRNLACHNYAMARGKTGVGSGPKLGPGKTVNLFRPSALKLLLVSHSGHGDGALSHSLFASILAFQGTGESYLWEQFQNYTGPITMQWFQEQHGTKTVTTRSILLSNIFSTETVTILIRHVLSGNLPTNPATGPGAAKLTSEP